MILFRYTLRQMLAAILTSTIILMMIVWLTRSLSFLSMMTVQGLEIITFFKFTLIMLPDFILILTPITFFGSVLFVFNKLMNDRELFVMKSMGLSFATLAKPVMALGLALTLIGYSLSLYYAPKAYSAFKELQFSTNYDLSNIVLPEGEFTTITPNLMIYFKSKEDDGAFRGVLIYENKDEKKTTFLFAEKAYLIYQENGAPKIIMTKGTREEIDRTTGKSSLLYFDSYSMDIFSSLANKGSRSKKVKDYDLFDLLNASEKDFTPQEVGQMHVEAHRRMSNPLLILSLGLVGAAGMLLGSFNRRSQAMRLIVLVAVAGIMETAYVGTTNIAKKVPLFLYALYAVPVLPMLISLWLLCVPKKK